VSKEERVVKERESYRGGWIFTELTHFMYLLTAARVRSFGGVPRWLSSAESRNRDRGVLIVIVAKLAICIIVGRRCLGSDLADELDSKGERNEKA
jgi:hypothetical protein